jgi:hypothetical protein
MEERGILIRLKERLGTNGPGVTIAVIALVVALTGGAYAAATGGLTGKQKKEVEKIAKKSAGKPGATGPQGAAGAKGDTGAEGKEGKLGTSVTSTAYSGSECAEGGIEVKSASPVAYVCNGEEGSPWTDGGTLPPGATETGIFSMVTNGTSTGYQTVLSLPIPLAALIETEHTFISGVATDQEFTAECGSKFAVIPSPKPGVFCIYAPEQNEATSPELQTASGGSGVSPTGTILGYTLGTSNGFVRGSFAVTGCSEEPGSQFPCPSS